MGQHTLRPRQNGRYFPDDIFKYIFLNENIWISFAISPNFVPMGTINNIPALVQIMACRRTSDKPLSEPMMVSLLTHIYASLGINELTDIFQPWKCNYIHYKVLEAIICLFPNSPENEVDFHIVTKWPTFFRQKMKLLLFFWISLLFVYRGSFDNKPS